MPEALKQQIHTDSGKLWCSEDICTTDCSWVVARIVFTQRQCNLTCDSIVVLDSKLAVLVIEVVLHVIR